MTSKLQTNGDSSESAAKRPRKDQTDIADKVSDIQLLRYIQF